MTTRRITYTGLLAACAIIISYFEFIIPPFIPVPGIKLGFANIIVLIVIYNLSNKEAFSISLIRILVMGFLFGNASSLIYSATGGIISLAVMIFMKKINIFSIIGVSVLGAVFHNLAQLVTACFVVSNFLLFFYAPILIISGIITGITVGLIGYFSNVHLKKLNLNSLSI